MQILLCALLGYFFGNINPAFIIAKFKGFDIRERGSGNAGASNIIPEERIPFEDSVTSPEYFEELFSTAIAKAEKFGSSLYCGEYGCIDIVSPEDTVKWYKAINSVFEKHGIGRAAWNYKAMDFGLSDERLNNVHNELIKLL